MRDDRGLANLSASALDVQVEACHLPQPTARCTLLLLHDAASARSILDCVLRALALLLSGHYHLINLLIFYLLSSRRTCRFLLVSKKLRLLLAYLRGQVTLHPPPFLIS